VSASRDHDLDELRRSAVAGNERDANTLMEVLKGPLTGYLLGKLRDPDAREFIEDVLQETLMRIYSKLGSCRATESRMFVRWCLTIAGHCASDQFRRLNVEGRRLQALDVTYRDSAPLNAANADDGDTGMPAEVLQALAELTVEQQSLLWHRVVCGEQWPEVGREHGITAGAAKRRYQRLRERLRCPGRKPATP
jgi:RNA polymerase sigma factor (sigma-70 family)